MLWLETLLGLELGILGIVPADTLYESSDKLCLFEKTMLMMPIL